MSASISSRMQIQKHAHAVHIELACCLRAAAAVRICGFCLQAKEQDSNRYCCWCPASRRLHQAHNLHSNHSAPNITLAAHAHAHAHAASLQNPHLQTMSCSQYSCSAEAFFCRRGLACWPVGSRGMLGLNCAYSTHRKRSLLLPNCGPMWSLVGPPVRITKKLPGQQTPACNSHQMHVFVVV